MKSFFTSSVIVALLILPPLATGQESPTPPKSDDTSFLEPGTWWNLYFSMENNPLQRGRSSIHAVKILELNQDRPSWIRIKFPKNREEHFSIFQAAAKARDDEHLSTVESLIGWEKTISEWRVMWVNLRFVVHITKVEPEGAATGSQPTRRETD